MIALAKFGTQVLNPSQMKTIKGGLMEMEEDKTITCVCCAGPNKGKTGTMQFGPDDDFEAAVEWFCGSASDGCCNCCGC